MGRDHYLANKEVPAAAHTQSQQHLAASVNLKQTRTPNHISELKHTCIQDSPLLSTRRQYKLIIHNKMVAPERGTWNNQNRRERVQVHYHRDKRGAVEYSFTHNQQTGNSWNNKSS
jgi:hypothetical protein